MSSAMPDVEGMAADESWIVALRDPGPMGQVATRKLHDLVLRAARKQVHRLRGQLPGANFDVLEDIAQQAANDATVAVLAKLDTFEGRSRFSTWVYKFGVFHAGAAVRHHQWRGKELPSIFDEEIADARSSPSRHSEANDLSEAISRAILTDLTDYQASVMVALLIEHVPIDVLATRTGTTRNALYKTLHDARQRLRTSLVRSGHIDSPNDKSTP